MAAQTTEAEVQVSTRGEAGRLPQVHEGRNPGQDLDMGLGDVGPSEYLGH